MLLKLQNRLCSFIEGPTFYKKSHYYTGSITASKYSDMDYDREYSRLDENHYDNDKFHMMIYDALSLLNINDNAVIHDTNHLIKIPNELEFSISMIHNINEFDFIIFDDSFNCIENLIGITNKFYIDSAQEIKYSISNGEFVEIDHDCDSVDCDEAYNPYDRFIEKDYKVEKEAIKYKMYLPNGLMEELLPDLKKYVINIQQNSYNSVYRNIIRYFEKNNKNFGKVMNLSDEELSKYTFMQIIGKIINLKDLKINFQYSVLFEAINYFFKYGDRLNYYNSDGFYGLMSFLSRWNSLYSIRQEIKMKNI